VNANTTLVLTASPASGKKFLGWGGACAGTRLTCSLTVTSSMLASARFSGDSSSSSLSSLGRPLVKPTPNGFLVTLRFRTTVGGTVRIRGLRAGRTAVAFSRRAVPGKNSIGPFSVAHAGLYVFEVQLAGRKLTWSTCLGRCGAKAPPPALVLTRGRPATTRDGDAWSVTLRVGANVIFAGQAKVSRGAQTVFAKTFVGRRGGNSVGPFVLPQGRYTIRVTAVDAFGRTRSLVWVLTLAR
jgi:hypothetical protein